MPVPTEFEPLLKEVVTAKRLSASKITKLTDIALKGMENDTQLVSILYRTHKSLPASSKVSSLYVFDALSRAARSFANKKGLVGDIQAPLGNCATFLLKVEGVLDGLIQDLMSTGAPEAQEKTRKILDIWTKGATFPPHVLARLTELTNKKKDSPTTTPPVDPRVHLAAAAVPSIVSPPPAGTPPFPNGATPIPVAIPAATPPPAPADLQSVLLALLHNPAAAPAAPVNGLPQTAANIAVDPLALIQQLAGQAQQLNGLAPHQQQQPIPLPLSALAPQLHQQHTPPYPGANGGGYTHPPPHGHVRSPPRHYDDRDRRSRSPPPRGGGRWGPPRGGGPHDDYRGGGGRGRGGFRDNDRGGREGGNGYRRRWSRSRSRSPPPPSQRGRFGPGPGGGGGGGGRREIRPYSPPRRPSNPQAAEPVRNSAIREEVRVPPLPRESGKDEFGRDIRPGSSTPEPASTSASAPSAAATLKSSDNDSVEEVDMEEETPPPGEGPQTTTTASSASAPPALPGVGLDKFNFASFNFAEPTSWNELGRAWQVTYGTPPTQEQLMSFIMSGGKNAQPEQLQQQQQQQQQRTYEPPPIVNKIQTFESQTYDEPSVGGGRGGWRGGGRGGFRGGFRGRGRGVGAYGSAGIGGHINGEWGYAGGGGGGAGDAYAESDAIVLGGGGGDDGDAWS